MALPGDTSESMRNRVLIVEDEVVIALETSSHLTDWGYEVCGIAASKRDAAEHADAGQPDLALVDVNLRGGDDGVEVAEMLRRGGAVVVFLTANDDAASRRRLAGARPAACLFKPYHPGELRNVLSRLRA